VPAASVSSAVSHSCPTIHIDCGVSVEAAAHTPSQRHTLSSVAATAQHHSSSMPSAYDCSMTQRPTVRAGCRLRPVFLSMNAQHAWVSMNKQHVWLAAGQPCSWVDSSWVDSWTAPSSCWLHNSLTKVVSKWAKSGRRGSVGFAPNRDARQLHAPTHSHPPLLLLSPHRQEGYRVILLNSNPVSVTLCWCTCMWDMLLGVLRVMQQPVGGRACRSCLPGIIASGGEGCSSHTTGCGTCHHAAVGHGCVQQPVINQLGSQAAVPTSLWAGSTALSDCLLW
jgi:hypothetical protein